MNLNQITPLILTFNEKENIARSVAPLLWAKEILIVDSGSTDGTADIARAAHPNVRIVTRDFDSFAAQCNFGLTQIETEWVLSMDADYLLTPQFIKEIRRFKNRTISAVIRQSFVTAFSGTLCEARFIRHARFFIGVVLPSTTAKATGTG